MKNSKPETFLKGRVTLYGGDCLAVMAKLKDKSLDSCVTDPPYGLGFMGKHWDHGVPGVDFWREVFRVLKPGAHLLSFAGTRTYHRMVCAIEDAGFEIRDQIGWCFGSGFPKSLDISKAIDRTLGCERTKICIPASKLKNPPNLVGGVVKGEDRPWREYAIERGFHEVVSDEAVSDEAVSWAGWGTALKPAWEPICVARKPVEGTIAANVLKWGTGALNIDGCRVGAAGGTKAVNFAKKSDGRLLRWDDGHNGISRNEIEELNKGRWPANIILDGSEEVIAAFPQTSSGDLLPHHLSKGKSQIGTSTFVTVPEKNVRPMGDSGSAARFFYSSKAGSDDRLGSKHPTVKPLDLMQYLVRLVTPLNGITLDLFAGTGMTGEAAYREGMNCILIEKENEYLDDIRRRMKLANSSRLNRRVAAAAEKAKIRPVCVGGLFD